MYVRVGIYGAYAMVLCTRSQDSLLSVSVCRVRVVSSTAGFKGGGSRDLRNVKEMHPESLAGLAGFEPKPLVH